MEISILGYIISISIPTGELIFLLLLLVMTVVAYRYMHKAKTERAVRFGNFETLKQVHGYKSFASPVILLLKVLVITLLFLVATGSITIVAEQSVSNTDFIFALDNSPSMMAPDYDPNRLHHSMSRIEDTINFLPQKTRVGVISFSGSAIPVKALSDDHDDIKDSIFSISPNMGDVGRGIDDAVEMGSDMLGQSDRNKTIVVITDGEDMEQEKVDELTNVLMDRGVELYIIGLTSRGTTEHIFQELQDVLDQEGLDGEVSVPELQESMLEELAESSGGGYFRIGDYTNFRDEISDIVLQEEEVTIDSSYYLLTLIALLIITELVFYSKYGVL